MSILPHPDELPPVQFEFRRQHGVHQFELAGGEHVTAISQPSWDEFAAALEGVDDPGIAVVSPELITVSPQPRTLAEVPDLLARRADHVRDLSRRMPRTTILLGSITIAGVKPRNQLLFIRDGEQVGRMPKMPYLAGEARIFYQDYLPLEQQQRPRRDVVGMVCSDIIFHSKRGAHQEALPHRNLQAEYVDPIGPEVRTVLVSSCWITPYPELGAEIGADKYEGLRFIDPLRVYVGALMLRHPNLQDVVMADQLPPGVPASGPVNFHARRVAQPSHSGH